MKKQILNLGRALNKVQQKEINGGAPGFCDEYMGCATGYYCDNYICRKNPTSGGGGSGNPGSGPCIPDRFCVDEYDTCCIG